MPTNTLPARKFPSYRERLVQAQRLGYLRCDYPYGKLAHRYEELCQERQVPIVVISPKGRYFELNYQAIPDDPYVLTESALAELRRRAQAATVAGVRGGVFWLAPQAGAVTGLRADAVESLAFWLSETLSDPKYLRNRECEEA
jgi:hypothetical protein